MATNTGWLNAQTIANLDRDGKNAWSNTANAEIISNNTYASISITDAQDYSDWLRVSNFGISIPTGATITGIECRVLAYGTVPSINDDRISLVTSDGTVTSTNLAYQDVYTTKQANAKYIYYGGSNELWGSSWNKTAVESTNFGFVFSAGNTGTTTGEARVLHLQIRVHYDEDIKANWKRRCPLTLQSSAIATGSHNDLVFHLSDISFPSEAKDLDGQYGMKSDGSDLRISVDKNGDIQVPYQFERIEMDNNPANTKISLYFKVPNVNSDLGDFTFYIWYGNANASAPTFAKDVWDEWIFVHQYKTEPTALPHVVADESQFGLDVTINSYGTGAVSRVASETIGSGYAYEVNSPSNANCVVGTYPANTNEQSLTNGDQKTIVDKTYVFIGKIEGNNAEHSYNLVTGTTAAAGFPATGTIGFQSGLTPTTANGADVIANWNDGISSTQTGWTSNPTIVSLGHPFAEYNYRQSAVADEVQNNTPLALFGSIKGGIGMSIYENGLVKNNLESYFCQNVDTIFAGEPYPQTQQFALWNETKTETANRGGAVLTVDFTGVIKRSIGVNWHRTFYNQWLNESTSIVTGTAGNTADVVDIKVTVKDIDTSSPIEGARVFLKAASGGSLPVSASVSITRSGSTVTVTHTGHGLSDGLVAIKGSLQSEYNGIKSITVTGDDTYTFEVNGTPITPATGDIKATAVILNDLTDAIGEVVTTFEYTSDQPIVGVARKATEV